MKEITVHHFDLNLKNCVLKKKASGYCKLTLQWSEVGGFLSKVCNTVANNSLQVKLAVLKLVCEETTVWIFF